MSESKDGDIFTESSNLAYGAFMAGVIKKLSESDDVKKETFRGVSDSMSRYSQISSQMKPVKVSINDSYTNSLLGIGSGQNGDQVEKFTSFGLENTSLNWQLWTALYETSWVFRIAIDKPAQDEVGCGIEIKDDHAEDIQKVIRKSSSKLINLLRWGALYGGSVAFCMFKGLKPEDYAKPIDFNNPYIKNKVPHLYVVDRWYGIAQDGDETVEDMSSLDFSKPKYYRIVMTDGTEIRVHHSFILRYEHRDAPMFIKKGMLQDWGYAEGCHIFNELSRDEKLKNSIQSLIDKSLIEVIKMKGMAGVFMGSKSSQNQQLLQDRLEMVSWARSFNSLTFLDKDDEYQEHGFSGLAGLADLLSKNMWLIAAALEMPGILYGNLTSGFGDDADALKRYDQTIQKRCEAFYRVPLEKYIWIICGCMGLENQTPEFEFTSLYKNETDKDKMKGMEDFITLLDKLLQSGIITGKKYATILNDYTMKGKINISFTEKELDEIADNVEQQMEDINV